MSGSKQGNIIIGIIVIIAVVLLAYFGDYVYQIYINPPPPMMPM